MLQVCIFVPFLHVETPKPQNVPKVAPLKDNVVPQADLIRDVLNHRLKIGMIQKQKEQEQKELLRQQEMGYQESQSLAENSIYVGHNTSVESQYKDEGMSLETDMQRESHPIAFPIFTAAQVREQSKLNAAAIRRKNSPK